MRKILRALAVVVAALAFQVPISVAADFELRLGDDVAADSLQGLAMDRFAQEVAKRNAGLKIDVFHSSSLGTGVQMIQNVKIGVQDMVNTGYELLDVFSDEMKAAEVPFVFADFDQFKNWLQSPAFEKVQQTLITKANQRIINLGVIWRRGPFRVMIAANKPVLTPADLGDEKLRIAESQILQYFWGKDGGMGATIQVLPLADVYLSLRNGVVNAIMMPLDLVQPMKFTEVAKYVTVLNDYPQFLPILINEQKWQQMSDAQRKALTDSADEAGRFYNSQVENGAAEWRKALTDAGVHFYDIDRTPWIDRAAQINANLEKQGKLPAGFLQEIQKYRGK
jgi:TRAP-type C4-dicarboxylate transport system substrate-binding protein